MRKCPRRERTVEPHQITDTVLEFVAPIRCDDPIANLGQECGSDHFRVVRRGLDLVMECRGCGTELRRFTGYLEVLDHVRGLWSG